MSAPSALLAIASGREVRRELRRRLGEHRGLCALALALLVAAAACALVVPPLLGELVDIIAEERPASAILAPAVAIAVAAVAQAILGGVGGQLVARLGETLLAGLREQVVDRALALPAEQRERAGSGDVLSRISGDVQVVSEAVRQIVPNLARAGLLVVLTLGALLVLDWRLALAALAAAPVQVLGVRAYLRTVVPIYRRERMAEGERTQQLVAAMSGAETARALGLGGQRHERVRASSQSAVDVSLEGIGEQCRRFLPALNGAELIGLTCVLVTGFALVRADTITIGTATAAALYFHRAFDPVGVLLFVVDDAQQATTALARLVGVAALPPAPPRRAIPAVTGAAALALESVEHSYDGGPPVLRAIDLTLRPGERVALIGTTGAGKTTLARIAAGVTRPERGRVLLGGRVVDSDDRAAVAAAVSLVTQEVHVFAGSLRDDLRLAAPDAGAARLWSALGAVGARDWVAALADGLQTRVGDGGHPLSATQAQQIALARLLLRDPPIVVLDEATAEAGSSGARELERAADRAVRGRTALVVAHRLTQAARADRVVVLEAGRIVEQGSPAELLLRDGPYAALWRAWAKPR